MKLNLPATDADVLGVLKQTRSLLPAKMSSTAAWRELLAIGRQESGFRTRQQEGGPAHGLWQFERVGVQGVMVEAETSVYLINAAQQAGVEGSVDAIYAALLEEDVLAAVLARLTLWLDPHPLPQTQSDGWATYLRTWRPGKPRPADWAQNWALAQDAISDESVASRVTGWFRHLWTLHKGYDGAAHESTVEPVPAAPQPVSVPSQLPESKPMKYIGLIIALAKIISPLYDEFKAAVAEGKSADPTTVKLQKILQDADAALQDVLGAL